VRGYQNASVPAKVRKPPFIPSAPVPAVGIMMVIGMSVYRGTYHTHAR